VQSGKDWQKSGEYFETTFVVTEENSSGIRQLGGYVTVSIPFRMAMLDSILKLSLFYVSCVNV
jgi:hypothetical protein